MLENTEVIWNAFHKISLMKRQFPLSDHEGVTSEEKLKQHL